MGNIDWALVASVVVTGLVVVFLSLIILIVAVSVIGKIFETIDNKKKLKMTDSTAKNDKSAEDKSTEVVLEVSEDDSDEVVAVITAAIAAVMQAEGNKKPFVIKSVKRVSGVRNVWNQAGLIENTQTL